MEYHNYLKNIIIDSRHKFIIGEEFDRTTYLKELASNLTVLNSTPTGIYIEDNGLISCDNKDLDKLTINSFHNLYVEMLFTKEILNKLLMDLPPSYINKISPLVLAYFNRISQNKLESLTSLEELYNTIKEIKDIITNKYEIYLQTGNLDSFADELPIFFVGIDFLVSYIKHLLPSINYLIFFINKKDDYSIKYVRALNNYLASRCNGDYSLSIGINNENEWPTYLTPNNNFIEYIHDYTIVDMNEWKRERRK